MNEVPGQAVRLSPEDKIRMRRLTEEIVGRYTEMALIAGRTLKDDGLLARVLAPGGKITLHIKKLATLPSETEPPEPIPDGGYACIELDGMVYEDPPGHCRPGTC